MPRVATLSIAGLYNYDDSIFDGFRVPESIADKRQDIIDEICLEAGQLTLVYTNATVMKFAIEKWTNLNFKIWEEMQATREYVYNPIWNKDGTYTELETRNLQGTHQETAAGLNTVTKEGEIDTQIENINEAENIKSVQGFDSTDWAQAEKEEGTGSASGAENTASRDVTESSFQDGKQGTTSDTGTIRHERTEQGNIGVTTTQQMIKEQRDVVQFSTERFIIDSFIDRFCLLVF